MENKVEFQTFLNDGEDFIKRVLKEIEHAGLQLEALNIDHLCFRVGSESEYFQYKNLLLENAVLLTEVPVNGRSIATFKLSSDFKVGPIRVDIVELPFPKVSSPYQTGFEHLEIVINESFASFKNRNPHLHFEPDIPKLLNPELQLKFEGFQVKFHHVPLERIIEIEKMNLTDIVLDLDGTLINSDTQIHLLNQRVFAEMLGREVHLDEVQQKFHSEFKALCRAFEIEDREQEFVETWARLSKEFSYELFEGNLRLLSYCKIRGLRVHLWTARDQVSTEHILNSLGLLADFDSVSCSYSNSAKPQKNNFSWLNASVKGDGFLMLGDSANDMLAAKNINAVAAGAVWSRNSSYEKLLSAGAELVFKTSDEILNWLKEREHV